MKLSNQDIWLAYPKLKVLSEVGFPPETSEALAAFMCALQEPYALIEHERTELVNRYGKRLKGTDQITVGPDNPNAGEYAIVFSELLRKEREVEIEKVKLPEKLTIKCESCGEESEVVYSIHPQVLIPLVGKFIEPSNGNGKGARIEPLPLVAKPPEGNTESNTLYYSIPMQIYMAHNIKHPLLKIVDTLVSSHSLVEKVKALWRLRQVWRDIRKIPEPTLENTWHTDSHNLIILRDWLARCADINVIRNGFIRTFFNFLIVLHDFDPPWRFIMDSVRDEAFKMQWQPRGSAENYHWWREPDIKERTEYIKKVYNEAQEVL